MNNANDILPEGISIEEEFGKTIITYEWYSNFYIPLFIFFLIWDGGLIYYFLQAIAHHEPNMLGALLYASPQILIGLFMTYYLIAIVVNQTIIELGNAELSLVHTPLPWRGNHQTVSLFDIQRIACERGMGTEHSPSTDIVLYFKDGERRKLISGIENKKTAFFIRDQIWGFRNRSLHLDVSPAPPSVPADSYLWDDDVAPRSSARRSGFALLVLFVMLLVGGTLFLFYSYSSSNVSSTLPSPDSYERIEVWDLQGDDTVRFTMFDTFPVATSKQRDWFSIPLVWKDTDIANAVPIAGTLIEHRVSDLPYNNQTYRSHSYLIESDQRTFGCSVTFAVLPHLHVTGTSSRLISIGLYPSDTIAARTRSVIVVILPDGVSDIAVTDMKPYKTLTQQARTLYYYDVKSVMSHESIHIAYTLTGISTTDINLDAVIENSKP